MTILHFSFCILHFALATFLTATLSAAPPLVVPATGEPFHAELAALDADWQITFRDGSRYGVLPAADLVCWGQCPEQGRAGALVLADGGLLTADIVAADRQRLVANSDLFGTLEFPLPSLAGAVFHSSSDPTDRDRLLDRIVRFSPLPLGEGPGVRAANQKSPPLSPRDEPGVRATDSSDRLLLENGDELTGRLVRIADRVINFETDVGPIDLKTDRVTAIIFGHASKPNPTNVETPLRAWVGLSDGSRLLATRVLVEGDSLKLTAADQPLAASRQHLVFLQPLGGRCTYLSDLQPTEYHQTPYLDLPWPYQADRNVTGGLLRSHGRLYLKGLGVHSTARLVYSISPLPLGEGPGVRAAGQETSPPPLRDEPGVRAKQFGAQLAIDDSTDGGGSVRFHVLVDGQERYASPILRGGDPPVPISVDISAGRLLELIVDYADRADVLDHANWLDARLTR